MDIHGENDPLFAISCQCGELEYAQWLYSECPDINVLAYHDWAFRKACEHNHSNVAEWLVSLYPERYSFEIIGEGLESTILFQIHLEFEKKEILQSEITECQICWTESSDTITFCDHQYCRKCIDEWMKRSNTCPMCRQDLLQHQIFTIVPK